MCDISGGCGVVLTKIYVSVWSVHELGTGGAPFVCSGAVETTRLHVMMTFVPVCL